MTEAVERLVNLALFLAAARGPVSAERIRAEVTGYPEGQDEAAFLRMFERDKEDLRASGLVIVSAPDGTYRLDAEHSFVSSLDLSRAEESALRAACVSLMEDPSFPFARDLRFALAKIADRSTTGMQVTARLADEQPASQGAVVSLLAGAAASCKRATFAYTNAAGKRAPHTVEPYGLFLHAGRWYLVGRDTERNATRVYAVTRMESVAANRKRPRSPDFERPLSFDVSEFVGLPFQYGPGEPFEAVVRFEPSVAWRAPALTGGRGTVVAEEGARLWRVTARDGALLVRWAVANGPGISIDAPAHLADYMRVGMYRVADRHA